MLPGPSKATFLPKTQLIDETSLTEAWQERDRRAGRVVRWMALGIILVVAASVTVLIITLTRASPVESTSASRPIKNVIMVSWLSS